MTTEMVFRFDSSFVGLDGEGFFRWADTGDFNADGSPDVVAISDGSSNVSVFLAALPTPRRYTRSLGNAQAVAAGDFDGDGRDDLAVAHEGESENRISILLSNGDGTFNDGVSFAATASQILCADLDGDGDLDLATPHAADRSISLWWGDGTGGFAEADRLGVEGIPRFLVAADLDGDGDSDLATVLPDGFQILLSQGGGSFTSTMVLVLVPCSPRALALYDMNGDASNDVVLGCQKSIIVLSNVGGGRFIRSATLEGHGPAGSDLRLVAASTIDADARGDIAALWWDGTLSVFRGTPGGFLEPMASVAPPVGRSMLLLDFDADSREDVLVAASSLAILRGNGDGTFGSDQKVAVAGAARAVASADLNADATLDIAITYESPDVGGIAFYLGDGRGNFTLDSLLPLPRLPHHLAIADLNLDGNPDVVVSALELTVLLNHGNGRFDPARSFGIDSRFAQVGDFDRDGLPDLVDTSLRTGPGGTRPVVTFHRGRGDGTFEAPSIVAERLHTTANALEVRDLDGDGNLDVVVGYSSSYFQNNAPSGVCVLRGHGDGTFDEQVAYDPNWSVGALAIGHADGDAQWDIVAAQFYSEEHGSSFRRSTLPGNGDATFGARLSFPGTAASGARLHDLDGDGRDELIETLWSNDIRIGHARGDGVFQDFVHFGVGKGPTTFDIADLNGDGQDDLVVANGRSAHVSILWNRQSTTPVAAADFLATPEAGTVHLTWSVGAPFRNDAVGVHVERARRESGPFERLTTSPLRLDRSMSFADATIEAGGSYWYRLVLATTRGSVTLAGPIEAFIQSGRKMWLGVSHEPTNGAPIRLRYFLPSPEPWLELEILDVRGRRIHLLDRGPTPAGLHSELWDRTDGGARRVPRGVYFVRLTSESASAQAKMILTR